MEVATTNKYNKPLVNTLLISGVLSDTDADGYEDVAREKNCHDARNDCHYQEQPCISVALHFDGGQVMAHASHRLYICSATTCAGRGKAFVSLLHRCYFR